MNLLNKETFCLSILRISLALLLLNVSCINLLPNFYNNTNVLAAIDFKLPTIDDYDNIHEYNDDNNNVDNTSFNDFTLSPDETSALSERQIRQLSKSANRPQYYSYSYNSEDGIDSTRLSYNVKPVKHLYHITSVTHNVKSLQCSGSYVTMNLKRAGMSVLSFDDNHSDYDNSLPHILPSDSVLILDADHSGCNNSNDGEGVALIRKLTKSVHIHTLSSSDQSSIKFHTEPANWQDCFESGEVEFKTTDITQLSKLHHHHYKTTSMTDSELTHVEKYMKSIQNDSNNSFADVSIPHNYHVMNTDFDIKKKIKGAAQTVGSGISDAAHKAGDGVAFAAEKTGEGVVFAAHRTGEGVVHAAQKTAQMAKKIDKFLNPFGALKSMRDAFKKWDGGLTFPVYAFNGVKISCQDCKMGAKVGVTNKCKWDLKNHSKDRAASNVTISAPLAFTYRIEILDGGEFAISKDLIKLPLITGALLFMIGPVPIVLSAAIKLQLMGKLSFPDSMPAVELGHSMDIQKTGGFDYANGKTKTYNKADGDKFAFKPKEIEYPIIGRTAVIKLGINLSIEAAINALATVSFNVFPHIRFDVAQSSKAAADIGCDWSGKTSADPLVVPELPNLAVTALPPGGQVQKDPDMFIDPAKDLPPNDGVTEVEVPDPKITLPWDGSTPVDPNLVPDSVPPSYPPDPAALQAAATAQSISDADDDISDNDVDYDDLDDNAQRTLRKLNFESYKLIEQRLSARQQLRDQRYHEMEMERLYALLDDEHRPIIHTSSKSLDLLQSALRVRSQLDSANELSKNSDDFDDNVSRIDINLNRVIYGGKKAQQFVFRQSRSPLALGTIVDASHRAMRIQMTSRIEMSIQVKLGIDWGFLKKLTVGMLFPLPEPMTPILMMDKCFSVGPRQTRQQQVEFAQKTGGPMPFGGANFNPGKASDADHTWMRLDADEKEMDHDHADTEQQQFIDNNSQSSANGIDSKSLDIPNNIISKEGIEYYSFSDTKDSQSNTNITIIDETADNQQSISIGSSDIDDPSQWPLSQVYMLSYPTHVRVCHIKTHKCAIQYKVLNESSSSNHLSSPNAYVSEEQSPSSVSSSSTSSSSAVFLANNIHVYNDIHPLHILKSMQSTLSQQELQDNMLYSPDQYIHTRSHTKQSQLSDDWLKHYMMFRYAETSEFNSNK